CVLRSFNHLLSSVSQAGSSDNIQAAVGQYFSAEFSVVTFEANHDRNLHAYFFNSTNNAFSDHVATHNAAENVDQYGFHIFVRQNNFKRFDHALFGCTAAHVE